MLFTSRLFTRSSPAIRASYSASLFVARKPQWIDYSIMSPWGDLSTSPNPLPLMLLDPSTNKVHFPTVVSSASATGSCSACTFSHGVKSATKSANTCDFIADLGRKLMSYSLSSTAHFVSRPKSLGLCKIFLRGTAFTDVSDTTRYTNSVSLSFGFDSNRGDFK
ncbi:hypothetical protein Q3G72_021415 [Acer saccharum]|nr:hypothetical protein Q3G72_021415 [Acer saccharum]